MAEFVNVNAPVGLRGRAQNVTNNAEDQAKVIQLLGRIPLSEGGKMGVWGNNKFILNNGSCPKPLADAIWDFQLHWKNRGVFKNIDGVVDRDGNTIKKMNGLIRSVAPIRVIPTKVDVIVRFSGTLKDVRPHTEDEVFPDIHLFHYNQKENRRLVRLGQLTNTAGAESVALIAKFVSEIQSTIKPSGQGPFIAEEPGAIFIYGASSGGRNTIDLAAALTKLGFQLRFVAVMDAAFFPNSPELTNSPDNFIGEPKVIPRFGVATIAAQEKFNYFQTIGNHSEMTFHGRLFSSSMDGKEIHGEINGFSNINLDDDVIASMPLTTDSAAHDNSAHIRLSDAAIPRVLGKIKYALDSLP